jgi:hypothetical protein
MESMIDLGRKSGLTDAPVANKENKKYYPSMYVPLDMVKGKEVGDMCRFEIVVKITGMNDREEGSEANLEVRSAKYIGKAGKATKDEYSAMSDKEREAHDKRMMEREEEEDSDNLDGEE